MGILKTITFGLMLGFLMSVSVPTARADHGRDRGNHGNYEQNHGRGGFGSGFMADNRDRGERRNVERRNVQQRNVIRQNIERRNVQQRNVIRQNIERRKVEQRNVIRRQQQNVRQPNVGQRNVERRNVERRNVERRNVERRNVERPVRRDSGSRVFRRDDDRGRRPGYVLDRRYDHDRYYPRRGFFFNTLPNNYLILHHHGDRYYYHSGIWYRPSGLGYVVVMPPFGLIVPILPPFYTTIWVAGVPYYYADGIYYVWQPADQGYVVTAAPDQSSVSTQPPDSDQFYVYPMKGQSSQQQAEDRYECHKWAVGQTGFDPSLPVGNLSSAELISKKSEYRRAIQACLTARGYSVR